MAHANPTPINQVGASTNPRRGIPPETRTVEARFYTLPSDARPWRVLIDGVAYGRDHEQEKALAMCRQDEAEAALLALIPEAGRQHASHLLLQAVDAHSDWHTADRDRLEAHLVEMLRQHEPMIRAIFDPEDSDIPISEAVRHMRCTLAPEKSSTQEDAQ